MTPVMGDGMMSVHTLTPVQTGCIVSIVVVVVSNERKVT